MHDGEGATSASGDFRIKWRLDDGASRGPQDYVLSAEVSDQTVAVEAEAHLLRLDEEWGNLRAGLEWSCRGGDPSIALRLSGALWRFWWDRGAAREGTAWYEAALAAGADEPEELRARALYGAANMAMARNDPAEAILLLERCLPVFRLGGDDLRAMRTVNDLGISSEMAGDFERARRYFEESLALALASSDERSAASARVNLAYVALQEDRLEDRAVVGPALQNLALADVRSADLDSAASNVRESIRLARDVADMRGVGHALAVSGAVLAGRGDWIGAARVLAGCDALCRDSGFVLESMERSLFERARDEVREALGEAALDQAWAEAETSAMETIVEQVLNDLE